MFQKYRWVIIVFNLLLFLVIFNNSVFNKEKVLSDGQLILLELAPADPRSLMQGDYMNLRYSIANNVISRNINETGYIVLKLNSNRVLKFARIQEDITPIHKNEYIINYTTNEWGSINIGPNSYFFQEGEAYKFDEAEFGGIIVDNKGNSILIGLYDKNRKKIE